MPIFSDKSCRHDISEYPVPVLLREFSETRTRWEEFVKKNLLAKKTVRGESGRSPRRVLYFVVDSEWIADFKTELRNLQSQLAKPENRGIRKGRKIWLPTVIEFAKEIQLVIYRQKSSRQCDTTKAREFLEKAKSTIRLPSIPEQANKSSYMVQYFTGRRYKLRVTSHSGKKIDFPFTDWAVCICDGPSSLPRSFKRKISDQPVTEVLATRGKSALFVNAKSNPADAKKLMRMIRIMNIEMQGQRE